MFSSFTNERSGGKARRSEIGEKTLGKEKRPILRGGSLHQTQVQGRSSGISRGGEGKKDWDQEVQAKKGRNGHSRLDAETKGQKTALSSFEGAKNIRRGRLGGGTKKKEKKSRLFLDRYTVNKKGAFANDGGRSGTTEGEKLKILNPERSNRVGRD